MDNIIRKLYEYLGNNKFNGTIFKIEDRYMYHEIRIYATYKSFSKMYTIDYFWFSINSLNDICLKLEKQIYDFLLQCYMEESRLK